jgi:hypothetical protein
MGILNASPTRVFRRKPVDEVGPEDLQEGGGLQHVLGLWQLTAIGIGGIIGAGIFSLAGAVAKDSAGPGVLLSFLVAGIASACAALSYAEFASIVPKARRTSPLVCCVPPAKAVVGRDQYRTPSDTRNVLLDVCSILNSVEDE